MSDTTEVPSSIHCSSRQESSADYFCHIPVLILIPLPSPWSAVADISSIMRVVSSVGRGTVEQEGPVTLAACFCRHGVQKGCHGETVDEKRDVRTAVALQCPRFPEGWDMNPAARFEPTREDSCLYSMYPLRTRAEKVMLQDTNLIPRRFSRSQRQLLS